MFAVVSMITLFTLEDANYGKKPPFEGVGGNYIRVTLIEEFRARVRLVLIKAKLGWISFPQVGLI